MPYQNSHKNLIPRSLRTRTSNDTVMHAHELRDHNDIIANFESYKL